MRKRVLRLFTVLVLCLTFLPFSAFSVEEELDTKVPGMIINTERLEGRDNSETGETFAPIMQDVDETNSAVVLLGASKQVSSSAIEDFVKTAENKKGEGRFSGLPTTGDWCAYFVAWAMQNSTLEDELKQNGNTFSVGSLGGAPSSPSYLARNGYGSIYISPGSATASKTNTYRNSLLRNHNVPSEAIKIQSYTPVRGDIVMFDWRKNDEYNFSHVGIMTSSTTTIEGNTNGGIVASHNFNTDSYQKTHVVGYFHFESVSNPSPPGESTLSISGEAYPTGRLNQGSSFGLRGVITSNYKLTDVSAWVLDASGNIVMEYHHNPDSCRYDIRTDGLNDAFVFNNLSAGYYSYAVDASDSSGMTRTLISNEDSRFQIGDPTPPGSTLHIEDPVYPTGTLEPGHSFGLRGIIRSNYTLTNVSAKVEDASGNTVMWYSANPGGYSYDIRTGFNNTFIFDNLSVGHYKYVVSASDSSPTSKTLIDSEFDVGAHTHQKGAYQWYEDTHPHYKYWTCSICGGLFTDGSTAHVDTCSDCVEPGKPSLTGMKSVYASGEAVVFQWGDTVNTTHYNLAIDRKINSEDYERIETVYYAEKGLSRTLETGEYRALISSTNSNSWGNYDGWETWRFTNSDWVSFTVNPPVPSNPQMSVNKESIVAGEEITFTYGATDATSYYIGVDRDGSRILSQNVPTSGFTTSFSEPGQYSAYVSCSNAAGFVDSNRVSFTVNLPKYYLDVNGYLDGAAAGGLGDYGTVDVWINGSLEADDVSDYYARWPAGTSYEITDIKPKDGYSYNGVHEGARTGSVGSGAMTITFNFSKIDTANLPKPSKTEAFNGHSYLFYTEPVTWYTAKKLCEAMGGHLVTITDEEENQFVHSLREENRAWIGATSADGTWKWITGEPFSYNKWAAEEPNNDQGNDEGSEHYTEQAYWDGTWNDVAGCAVRGFVCEIDSAPSNAPQIAISDRTAAPGSSIRVPVLLKDNPGLVSFRFKVAYDASKLELTGVDNADYNLVAVQNLNSPVVFNFTDATGGDRTDTGAGALNFQVKDGASGEAAFSVVIDDPDDFYNAAGQPVTFSTVAGKVTIQDYTPGDVNDDGKVNNRDVGRLQQFLSDWDVTIVRAASDTNADGKINNRDVGRLQQFLSDWDVTLCGGTDTETQSGGARLQAAGPVTIAIDGRTAAQGETIQVPVLLKDNPGLVSFRFKVSYDSSKLELTGRDDADYALVALKDLNSPVIFNFTDATGGDKRAVNAGILNFKVKDGASGDAEFSIVVEDPDDFYNTSEDAIGVEISAGVIRITSDSGVSTSIEDVQRNLDNAVTANVACSDRTATVFCAVYNNAGRMLAVQSKQVTEAHRYDFQFGNTSFDYAKVFVLDSNFMPLCISAKTL